jgi:hypothetical protein
MINLRVVDLFHGDGVTSFDHAADAGIGEIIHKGAVGSRVVVGATLRSG